MVEIVRPGKLPENKRMRTICRKCKCEFIFEAKEARFVPDQRDGDYFEITCPTPGCNTACTGFSG